jgi:hypothetical protein
VKSADTVAKHCDPQNNWISQIIDKPPKPDLAQRFGLKPPPEPALGKDEWQQVECKSVARGDSKLPCPVCFEPFAQLPQIILSCSHVFHVNCLKAFERHIGKRVCPMCRKEEYQSKLHSEGYQQHIFQRAQKIQAAWRGYRTRKWFSEFRICALPTEPVMRRQVITKHLQAINAAVCSNMMRHQANVEAFLQDLDFSLHKARYALAKTDQAMAPSEDEWRHITAAAVRRRVQDSECAICLVSLCSESRSCTILRYLAVFSLHAPAHAHTHTHKHTHTHQDQHTNSRAHVSR